MVPVPHPQLHCATKPPPLLRPPLLLLLLHSAALKKPASLNLGVTARSLVDSYRTYRSDGRVEPLEEFVASAVAAFRCAYSLDVVLMELDLAGEASVCDDETGVCVAGAAGSSGAGCARCGRAAFG